MRYILWLVALLGPCDFTNNGRNLSRHLGFYQELEIIEKWCFFFVLDMKIISTLLDFSHKIYFYVGKSWKNVYFHSKMA